MTFLPPVNGLGLLVVAIAVAYWAALKIAGR